MYANEARGERKGEIGGVGFVLSIELERLAKFSSAIGARSLADIWVMTGAGAPQVIAAAISTLVSEGNVDALRRTMTNPANLLAFGAFVTDTLSAQMPEEPEGNAEAVEEAETT